MNRFFATLLLLFVSYVFTSCNIGTDPLLRKVDANDYFPLHVGNHWEYNNSRREEISRMVKIDGFEYFEMVNGYDSTYYRKDLNGNVLERRKDGEEILKFRIDIEEGETYNTLGDNRGMDVTLISKDETIKLGKTKVKNCYLYYFDFQGMADEEHYIWLGPGLGEIDYEVEYGINVNSKLNKARINSENLDF